MVKPSADAASAVQTMSSLGPIRVPVPARLHDIGETFGMVRMHVCEEDRVKLTNVNVDLREPQRCAATSIKLQFYGAAIVAVIAVPNKGASTGHTVEEHRALIVPVSVITRQGPACAKEKTVNQMVVAKNTVARQERCIAIAPKIVCLEIAEIWSRPQGNAGSAPTYPEDVR
jgi:hypothetical protein